MEKKSDEIWKKIVFEKIKDQVNHLYVSNLGRIKSNSKQSGGGILSGSLKEGYPSLSLRYMAPRSAKNEKIIQKWREEIEAKKENLNVLIAQKEKYKKGSRNFISITNEIKSAKKVLNDTKIEHPKKVRALDKERTTYYGGLVHSFVAQKFLKKPSKKHLYIIHLDYNKSNNNPSNLKWVTKDEWGAHQAKNPTVKKARSQFRGNYKGMKLNEKDVIKIKKLLQDGKRAVDLARKYDVSEMAIYRIKSGENWGHIKI